MHFQWFISSNQPNYRWNFWIIRETRRKLIVKITLRFLRNSKRIQILNDLSRFKSLRNLTMAYDQKGNLIANFVRKISKWKSFELPSLALHCQGHEGRVHASSSEDQRPGVRTRWEGGKAEGGKSGGTPWQTAMTSLLDCSHELAYLLP